MLIDYIDRVQLVQKKGVACIISYLVNLSDCVYFHGLVDIALLSVLEPAVLWLALQLVVERLLARELEAAGEQEKWSKT